MRALHIRDVDELVISRIEALARLQKRSMQAQLRVILEEAAARAVVLGGDFGDDLILADSPTTGSFRREEIYGDDAR